MSCQRLMAVSGILLVLTSCSGGGSSEPIQTSGAPLQPSVPPPQPVQSMVQQAYVKASNTSASSSFGGAVALDADTMVVGAQSEGTGAFRSGEAYVFARNGTTWTEQARLKAPNIIADERFGSSVALSGDTLVIGAPAPPSLAGQPVGSGSVYVFTRSGTTWIPEATIKASNPENSDGFGFSVALQGDTLVVGASGEDSAVTWVISGSPDEAATNNGAIDSGAVYVFTRTNGVWIQQAYIKASNSETGDGFGRSVALDGHTLVVGASGEDSSRTGVLVGSPGENVTNNGASNSGAVYVFTLSNNGWVQDAYVKASNTGSGDLFGGRVALVRNTLAVGAPLEDSGINGSGDDNSAAGSGAVYIFTRLTGGWKEEAYVKVLNPEVDDNFGSSLGLIDGTLAVGAPGKDARRGAVYIFTQGKGIWTQRISGGASNADPNDNFGGGSVALSGRTMAAGAIGESSNATGVNGNQGDNSESASGAAYVYTIE